MEMGRISSFRKWFSLKPIISFNSEQVPPHRIHCKNFLSRFWPARRSSANPPGYAWTSPFKHFRKREDPDRVAQRMAILGTALGQAGRAPEAIEHYQQALKIQPDFTAAKDALRRLGASQ